MSKIIKIAKRASIYLLAGLIFVYISLVTYLCSTTKIAYLINDTVKSSMPIVPSVVAELFLFNFRGGKKDIAQLKMTDDGLHYVTSVLINSNFSKEKKAKYIKYFVSKGCGVNDISSLDGFGPLHGAALSGDADTTELLLANGADPLLKTEIPKGLESFKNMTPLEVAELSQKKRPDIDYTKVIDILRKAEDKRRHS